MVNQSRPIPWGQIFFICIIALIILAWGFSTGFENILPGSLSEDDSVSYNDYKKYLIQLVGKWQYKLENDEKVYLVLYFGLDGEWSTEEVTVETFVWSCADNMIALDYPSDRDSDVLIIQGVDKNHLSILTPSKLFFELFGFTIYENVLVFQRATS